VVEHHPANVQVCCCRKDSSD